MPGPRRQLVVADLSPERRAEIRDVRKALETIAVRTACEVSSTDDVDHLRLLLIRQRRAADAHAEDDFIELDEEMHLAIAAAARLPVVRERMLTTIKGFVRVIRLGTARSRDHLYNVVFAEHEAIVDAIERRDSDAAVAALMAHLERADYARLKKNCFQADHQSSAARDDLARLGDLDAWPEAIATRRHQEHVEVDGDLARLAPGRTERDHLRSSQRAPRAPSSMRSRAFQARETAGR